ncbi:hypothetical protein AB5I41_31715 [Sphingomonas sp. MMS24-JH45]
MRDAALTTTGRGRQSSPRQERRKYEVWQQDAFGDGDAMVAGSDSLKDALHYALVYGQDGPAWVVEVTRRRLYLHYPHRKSARGRANDFVTALSSFRIEPLKAASPRHLLPPRNQKVIAHDREAGAVPVLRRRGEVRHRQERF